MKTVLALYDRAAEARAVVEELEDAGIARDQISIATHSGEYSEYLDDEGYVTYDEEDVSAGEGAAVGAVGGGILGLLAGLGAMAIPGIGPILAAGPIAGLLTGAGVGAVTGGVVAGLVDMGVTEEDAEYYAEGIRRGGTLVTVRTTEEMADTAASIMNMHNPVNIEQRAAAWSEAGWEGYDHEVDEWDREAIVAERDRYADLDTHFVADRDEAVEQVIPIVEEEARIGTRTVQRGGVRIHTHMEEVPVEEQVTLREEHVNVERRPANRAATEADFHPDVDNVIEMTETTEEVVMDKQARVTGEVVVSKDVDTRTETVRDSVRRTEVEVEDLDASTMDTDYDNSEFNTYESTFRQDYDTNYTTSDYTWEQYRPAYQYGYSLATHPQYGTRDWTAVEPEARRNWEERNEGTWEEFKDAVRRGWNEVREEVQEMV